MDPTQYQQLAARTECDQEAARQRVATDNMLRTTRLLHACLGLSGEVGELSAAAERWVYYGHDLDAGNVKEEVGDCLWYLALACNALGLDMAQVMEANIAKLRQRYPSKYSDDQALEVNRDRAAERSIVEGVPDSDQNPMVQNGQGWAEPPWGFNAHRLDNDNCDA